MFTASVSLAIALWGIEPSPHDPLPFIRGDSNQDSTVNISDALALLNFLFREIDAVDCLEAADVNGDLARGGNIDISDAVYLLIHLFASRPPPPPPFPDCGNAISFAGCVNSLCPVPPVCSIAAHGCMVEGVECPVFRTDEGDVLELVRGDVEPPPLGWCGTIAGTECSGCASICQQGVILKVCRTTPDPDPCPVNAEGCVVKGFACPVLETVEGRFLELVPGDVTAPEPGWCGTIAGIACDDCITVCNLGNKVRLCEATAGPNAQ